MKLPSCHFHNYYLLFELSEEWSEVRFRLGVSCTGQFTLDTSLHVVFSAVEIFGPNAKKKLQPKEMWMLKHENSLDKSQIGVI